VSIYQQLHVIQTKLNVPKNQFNSFGKYNYRSCEDILEAVKPLLGGLSLLLCDEIALIGDRYYLKATATLTDGTETVSVPAYAREENEKKGMDSAQLTGATSSYARKYALAGLFLLDDNKDADATNQHGKTEQKTTDFTPKFEETPAPPPADTGTVAPQTHDGLDQKQQQIKIGEWLIAMCESENAAADQLEELTTWTNKKGEVVKGKRNPFQLNTKPNAKGATQTSVTYTQVRDLYKTWEANNANA